MPENRDRGSENLSQMSTEELEQILRQDTDTPVEQETDTDFLLEVMEVLAERKRENGKSEKTAEEAWKSFQEYYAPKSGPSRSARPAHPRIRRLIAAAAALALILCIPVTARAFGWDELWDVVARWAKETFSFVGGDAEQVSEPSPTYDGEVTSFQEFLERSKIDCSMIPTWIPDGFVLEKVEKDITPGSEVYQAFYQNEYREVRINVKTFSSMDSWSIEIEDAIEICEVNGVRYYFFSNLNQLQVVWMYEPYECMISGDLSLEEAKSMIDSRERG